MEKRRQDSDRNRRRHEGFSSDRLEGLLRSLTVDIFGIVATVIVVLAFYWLFAILRRSALKAKNISASDANTWKWVTRWAVVVILVVASLVFVMRAASVSTINRLPRADVDPGSVYRDMERLAAPIR